ncbi:MAG TPA: EAL domain-containing protein [Solirubrobacterales bacterium]|jgi:diguanylate cyclase (GGDEF)-like protein/PAS domain S-box-containing protein|nr:EAL domain-containing protein [Solirubrobacterales bacterium]
MSTDPNPQGADRLYRALVETSTDVIVLIGVDGRIRFINEACREVLGFGPEEMMGGHVRNFNANRELPGSDVAFERILGGESRSRRRMTARRKDGTAVELMFNASPLRSDDGRVIGVVVIATDISDLIATQELLEEAEGRYRTLVEQLPAVSYIAEPGAKGTWQYVSPQLERMLGFSQEEWTADPTLWARRIHPEDRDRVLEEEERDSILGVPLASEYRMITKDGRVIWVRDEGVLRAERGERVHYEGMLTNVTERKSFESQLQFLADHDPLTGLFNRRRFVQELDLEIKLMRRDGHPSSLLMLDVDGLKQVNDAMGHQAGDALVRQTAEVLRDRLRGTDSVGRLGGDEFAVLLRGSRVNEAAAVAQVLLDRFRGREQVASAEPIRPTISIGLTSLRRNFTGADEAIGAADRAMYEAKRTGGDRVAMYSRRLPPRTEGRGSWADQIRDALDEDRIVLYRQPIIHLASREVHRHEVLIRMRSPEGDVLPPEAFLPDAERFDLVQELDRRAAHQAVSLIAAESNGEPLRLEVNVAAKTIEDPEFTEALADALREEGVDPANLILEVSEQVAVSDLKRARAFAERVAELGCGFALDNFGSGFGSFFYLKHLPVDHIKIDGDLIRGLSSSRVDREIVSSIVDVARSLDRETVGERVNDERTLELMKQLGVDYAQGFHLGPPTPVS